MGIGGCLWTIVTAQVILSDWFGASLGSLGNVLGLLGRLFGYFGVSLASVSQSELHPGSFRSTDLPLGTVWGHFGITLELLLSRFGIILRHFGVTWAADWNSLGHMTVPFIHLEALWGLFEITFGIRRLMFEIH